MPRRKRPACYTVQEVAELKGCTPLTVLNAIQRGKLTAWKEKGRWIIANNLDLETWQPRKRRKRQSSEA